MSLWLLLIILFMQVTDLMALLSIKALTKRVNALEAEAREVRG